MANLLLVSDPDHARRADVMRRAEPRLHLLPDLVGGALDVGAVAVRWAAGARAPISRDEDATGALLLVGDAIGDEGTRLDAAAVRRRWREADAAPAAFDGYHLAVDVRADGAVRIGADMLGWFPLYWWADGDVLLAGTSPELFALHPAFRAEFDAEALAGVLLVNNLAGECALRRGVRRLGLGRQLCWRPGGGVVERPQWEPPLASDGSDLPFAAYLERLDAALEDAMRRHLDGDARCGILLSGGLDSRMLAGYLPRVGVAAEALTFGRAGDTELRCARAVSRALGFAQHAHELPPAALVECARTQARWEHLANGFSNPGHWGRVGALGALPPRVVCGYAFDTLLFAMSLVTPAVVRAGRFSFDDALAQRNAWALPADAVARLLAPLGGERLVAGATERLRAVFEGAVASDFRRYWRFALHMRMRYHVGGIAWRLSFGSWPVLPALDRRLLTTIAVMPVAALSERRMQVELVRRKFPALARLPLDRNADDDTPLLAGARAHLRAAVRERLRPVRRLLDGGSERRFHYRTYDFDGEAWRGVRRAAEPLRARWDGRLDRATLDALLPPPDERLRVPDAISGSAGPKLLLGLLLWAGTDGD